MPPSDGLPESIHYRDEGCSVAPRCLDCPLPKCRFDVAGGVRAIRNAARDPMIIAASAGGASVDAISTQFGVSRRVVFRVLQASRKDVTRAA